MESEEYESMIGNSYLDTNSDLRFNILKVEWNPLLSEWVVEAEFENNKKDKIRAYDVKEDESYVLIST